MANTYFRFKQFIIQQDRCAMKVCTDACLFGAWTAERVAITLPADARILDIGTGTGLLALMLAQKTAAGIHAVELDRNAAGQAGENADNSPWSARISLINADIRNWHTSRQYELVISNPPFFSSDLKSPDPQRNLALHSEALRLDELIGAVKKNLAADGKFAVLLPWNRRDEFQQLAAEAGLFPEAIACVKQTPGHNGFRAMLLLTANTRAPFSEEIIIREGDHYSARFTALLRDYYLNE